MAVKKTLVAKKPVSKKSKKASTDAVACDVAPELKAKKVQQKRVRRVVTRESLEENFDALLKRVDEEVNKLRDNEEKVKGGKGVKFLRSVNKAIKILKSDSLRVLRSKTKSNRPRTTTSGFMKPVRISPEMASFTEWPVDKLCSRVDVTKFICKYIKENNLQNPSDKRQIAVDDKLSALLKYNPLTAANPLTYFRLQQYIQPHFIKDTSATKVEPTVTPSVVPAVTPAAASDEINVEEAE